MTDPGLRERRHSKVRTNAFVLIAATAFALAGAELLARLLGVEARFGQLIFVRGVSSRVVDGVALWDEAHPRFDSEDLRRAAADADAFEIVGLGDSIMFGVRLAKEDTYLEEARRELERRSNKRFEVLDLAVPGYNTMQENAVYGELEDQLEPDLVIVHFWSDDTHQYRMVGGYVVDLGNISESDGRIVVRALPVPQRVSDFLLLNSRLYDLLTQAAIALQRRPEAPDDWQRVYGPLDEIRARAQRAGAHVLVLVSPLLTGSTPQATDDVAVLREYGARSGIDVVDLATWVAGIDCKEIALDGWHFNARGHQLIGRRLADYVLQHYLPQRDVRPETPDSP